ncbi:hypothetical protein MGG_18023 [Pyricularia oryzae 70-15]|uniref:Uncharacterized protein n=3 Tax=Pyricularia oryzae TaxID=318829 RepID=G5EHX3_PYRO7|nr:uncharacterized protein MGG_18023 [Pyricularia oryzae 70-15]ELQ40695.1 hypothetical protein OOU_Y34scaffold00378g7 [Pyricularia oryzae Y34]KAI7911547.1 hypothetical protein M9X92_010464 [Pyricularia oryzae]EAQ70886.1 hypothetical protein MGCH7_ch7g293 [Pyricularia oryzae 70-15]EHA46478.1 hypothetical protein MGG_18023 [Pyricularia oryzae 70-15]KAI7912360.1 hypothetical protein M0657_010493 [Pyricularia oryzae]
MQHAELYCRAPTALGLGTPTKRPRPTKPPTPPPGPRPGPLAPIPPGNPTPPPSPRRRASHKHLPAQAVGLISHPATTFVNSGPPATSQKRQPS